MLDEELDTELPTDVDEFLYVRPLLLPLLLLLLPEVVVERDTDEEREPLLDEPLLTRLLFIPDDVAPLPLTVVVVLPFTLEVDPGKP